MPAGKNQYLSASSMRLIAPHKRGIALKPRQAGPVNRRAPEALLEIGLAQGQALFGRGHGRRRQ